jgi:hypothetical protein
MTSSCLQAHRRPSVWDIIELVAGLRGLRLLIFERSCENENTIESQITRCGKIAMATLWKSLVCWVHDADNWEFAEGWHSYVPLIEVSIDGRLLT